MKNFIGGFTSVFLVSANTWFISEKWIVASSVIAFLIGLNWAYVVSKISRSKTSHKLMYALGCFAGALISLSILNYIA